MIELATVASFAETKSNDVVYFSPGCFVDGRAYNFEIM